MTRFQPQNQTLLARARKKHGWTQEYVAQQVNVSIDTVRQWEGGRHFPYQATIQQLCHLFQTTPKELGLIKEYNILQDIQVTREVCEEEKKAAWEMYIELVTRIPIATLDQNEGILREALSSLYSLFQTSRAILRNYGSAIASDDNDRQPSVSYLVIRMLNTTLRPLLAKWHPLLKAYEETLPSSVSTVEHEQQWKRYTELRQEISQAGKTLIQYVHAFAEIAEVSSLIIDLPETKS